jgi:hypothetical protein
MSSQQHSRIGQILINKGLITRSQLDAAIQLQLTNHKRRGETLIEQGWITERQLKKALSKQTNLRLAATLVAALMMPFQPTLANTRLELDTVTSQNIDPIGMQELSEVELRDVSAQGLEVSLPGLFLQAENGNGIDTVKQLSRLLLPVLDSLQAETSLHDVHYDTSKLTSIINPDGSVNVRLPSSIGELRFDNIRVAGAAPGQSFGSLSLHDIDLSQASLKISMR